ncbi:dual specificity protein phosphatase 12 [Hesseltinella vesiculosa]|uniref:protein-tyrosine-phosphatase n=1 Tax=Hesseltinella vesiculosa TaxID=101127 RepID=A0A1X2GIG0_9FUNG|nr:dual specificity protein phosphatase 12 [Hesseltinella vesiculosa]
MHSHMIIPRLHVGDWMAAKNHMELLDNKISHIVAVGDFDLHHPKISYLNIAIEDLASENIIQHFDDSFDFIEQGRSQGTGVLVHCQAGMSRSVTVAAAYMMRKANISYERALEMIRIRRPAVQPNEGFMVQLELYESLNYSLDTQHVAYRRFLLSRMAEHQEYMGQLEQYAPAADPEYNAPSPDQASSSLGFVSLRCKKCRRLLVHSEHVIEHKPGKGQQAFSYFKRSQALNVVTDVQQPTTEATASEATVPTVNQSLNPLLASLANRTTNCSSHFIEPMEWMHDTNDVQGRIDCPKCASKLGFYSWSGEQCSCGRWITPAFMLHQKQVDQIRPVRR